VHANSFDGAELDQFKMVCATDWICPVSNNHRYMYRFGALEYSTCGTGTLLRSIRGLVDRQTNQ
jgi:hypothetical protein